MSKDTKVERVSGGEPKTIPALGKKAVGPELKKCNERPAIWPKFGKKGDK